MVSEPGHRFESLESHCEGGGHRFELLESYCEGGISQFAPILMGLVF